MADMDTLWGGTLTRLDVDLEARAVTLSISVTDGDGVVAYQVRLAGVSDLRVHRPDLSPWDYTEVTEVHLRSSEGSSLVELVSWAEPNGLEIRCENIEVARTP